MPSDNMDMKVLMKGCFMGRLRTTSGLDSVPTMDGDEVASAGRPKRAESHAGKGRLSGHHTGRELAASPADADAAVAVVAVAAVAAAAAVAKPRGDDRRRASGMVGAKRVQQ